MSSDNSMLLKKPKRIFKIIIIGDANVGKTCLSFRFCDGKLPKELGATIGVDFRSKDVEVDNEIIQLQLWDTAGQERFRKSMIPHYYRNVHAVMFVYDMTKTTSFHNLNQWIAEFKRYQGDSADIPKILVGNKCDCINQVAVSTSLAQKFADSHDMPLFETSATDEKESSHVNAIFITLAHKLKSHKPMMVNSLCPSYNVPRDKSLIRLDTAPKESEQSCCSNC